MKPKYDISGGPGNGGSTWRVLPQLEKKTMYAPDATCSLISYMDLKAMNIHVFTAMENDKDILELK